ISVMKHRSRLGVAALVAALGTTTCNDVSVTAVDVARIEISPDAPVVQVAGTVTLTARVLSQEGRALSGRTVSWRATDGQNALVDANGTVSGIGTGSTHVHATSSGVADSVLVTVEPRDPRIGLEPAVLTFDAVRGEASPPVQGVEITNAGGGVLDGLAVTVTYPGGQAGGWITTELSGGVAPATLSVGVDGGALAPGTYSGTVSVVSSAAGNSPQTVAVTLELVDAEPAIGVSSTTASFAASLGGADPASVRIDVTNSGGGTLDGLAATVVYPTGQPTGWLSAALAANNAPTALEMNATTGTLAVGTHTASVQVASDAATNSPVNVVVTLVVSDVAPGPPSNLSASVISPTQVDLAWQTATGTVSEYRIQQRTGTGAWREIDRVDGTVLAYESTRLAAATQY